MSNTYFKFKQFIIHQDKCAMKVCTDACLFGAWIADRFKVENEKIKRVLDIGAGTGLLSLMIAQKINAHIDAVEVDQQASLQANENFEASPWPESLTMLNTSLQHFDKSAKYDLIISNPPFFINSLQSTNALKNQAKHATDLTFSVLVKKVTELLASGGKFCVLLPCREFDEFKLIALENQLYLQNRQDVKQTSANITFRSMGVFTKEQSIKHEQGVMIIKDHQYIYTPEFVALLKDYYLYL